MSYLLPSWETLGGPYKTVLDIGGSAGAFALAAHERWPDARIISFEPRDEAYRDNVSASEGRWEVIRVAASDRAAAGTMLRCEPWPEASTLQAPGPTRVRTAGAERWDELVVPCVALDIALDVDSLERPLLLKVDVEGHEGPALRGAQALLARVDCAVVEVQNDPDIYVGSAPVAEVDEIMRAAGLTFAAVAGCGHSQDRYYPLQFDGVWMRAEVVESRG
jgi:FkbM family methyltransferase